MASFVWKRRSDDWIKVNPGQSYMYKEYTEGQRESIVQHKQERPFSPDPKNTGRSGVYVIICQKENHVYVGQSKNIDVRLRGHKMLLQSDRDNSKIYLKMRLHYERHGIEAFEFRQHSFCEPVISELLELEKKIMTEYVLNGYDLYNISVNIPLDERIYCPVEFRATIKLLVQAMVDDKTLCEKINTLILPRGKSL